ncbi:actin cytoskeleton-regulatory complex protein PAN1 [Ziziphus jujuba]|uniref:Actin cytoskeleton-regulatory complex protein PAN1 n=1 Tax=Ziziphus jujuba TaxID=326968 RepID=A0A6P3ZG84_ZIZJJ|nr:actin cytoskeleton-regulatory complex protein PAN1 [Ziziphus jujuba]
MASSKPLDLEITVVSAKHLKNVNWRNGILKPYATFFIDPDHRIATRPDETGSTEPVWNEHFVLPITRPLDHSVLTLQIFHSRPSETPKPLVGTLEFPLSNLADTDESTQAICSLELLRPSGRPQGMVRVKLALRSRPSPPPPPPQPDYHTAPYTNNYYSSAPPATPRDYMECPPTSSYSYSNLHSDYCSPPPPPYPRPFVNRVSSFGAPSFPSAPVDSSSTNDYYNPQPPVSSFRAMGLEDGVKYEEEKSNNYCYTKNYFGH